MPLYIPLLYTIAVFLLCVYILLTSQKTKEDLTPDLRETYENMLINLQKPGAFISLIVSFSAISLLAGFWLAYIVGLFFGGAA